MRTHQDKSNGLIYQILGIDETEYKLKSIPKNILSSINSIHIASKDIDVITDDIRDDANTTELMHIINSKLGKQKRSLLYLWKVTNKLNKDVETDSFINLHNNKR